ncbi:MAG: hypothetical protein EXS09_06735 [Gemmataceae bacterium]|nr:hypothetical protein [Gemmataceae bacterium]
MARFMLAAFCGLALLVGPVAAEDKVPVALKIVVKKANIAWPYGLGPKEFEARLKELSKAKNARYPLSPSVDMVLQFANTTKEKVTIYVEGDANMLTLAVKGPGVTTATPMLAVTSDFRLPTAVELEPGKTFEVQLKGLVDGFRKSSRYIYPLAPGEFSISATYLLATADGGKGALLKSGDAKFKIDEPK